MDPIIVEDDEIQAPMRRGVVTELEEDDDTDLAPDEDDIVSWSDVQQEVERKLGGDCRRSRVPSRSNDEGGRRRSKVLGNPTRGVKPGDRKPPTQHGRTDKDTSRESNIRPKRSSTRGLRKARREAQSSDQKPPPEKEDKYSFSRGDRQGATRSARRNDRPTSRPKEDTRPYERREEDFRPRFEDSDMDIRRPSPRRDHQPAPERSERPRASTPQRNETGSRPRFEDSDVDRRRPSPRRDYQPAPERRERPRASTPPRNETGAEALNRFMEEGEGAKRKNSRSGSNRGGASRAGSSRAQSSRPERMVGKGESRGRVSSRPKQEREAPRAYGPAPGKSKAAERTAGARADSARGREESAGSRRPYGASRSGERSPETSSQRGRPARGGESRPRGGGRTRSSLLAR